MTILGKLHPYWKRSQLLSTVDRVTARSQDAVWDRVRFRVPDMGIHEARGYIRARAAMVIQNEMATAIADDPTLGKSDCELIARTVRHRLVRRLLFESLRSRKTAAPSRARVAA